MPFTISIEQLDENGKVIDRRPLHYRFANEAAALKKADQLAGAYADRHYIMQGGFWEVVDDDSTRLRIVVDLLKPKFEEAR